MICKQKEFDITENCLRLPVCKNTKLEAVVTGFYKRSHAIDVCNVYIFTRNLLE